MTSTESIDSNNHDCSLDEFETGYYLNKNEGELCFMKELKSLMNERMLIND